MSLTSVEILSEPARAGRQKARSRLFRKYVVLLVGLVGLACVDEALVQRHRLLAGVGGEAATLEAAPRCVDDRIHAIYCTSHGAGVKG